LSWREWLFIGLNGWVILKISKTRDNCDNVCRPNAWEGAGPMTIEDWRSEIDAIDDQLLDLLNKRVGIAVKVGQSKKLNGVALRDPAREREVLERARNKNSGPLDEQAVEKLFSCIIRESRRIQRQAMDRNRPDSLLSPLPYVQAPVEQSDH